MKEYQSLKSYEMDCKYHVVLYRSERKKAEFRGAASTVRGDTPRASENNESKIVEGHLMGITCMLWLSIPPKYAVANVVGYIKEKSAVQIARTFGGRQRNFTGENFWARGYFVSTVGLEEHGPSLYPQPRGRGRAVRADEAWNVDPPPWAAHGFMAPLRRSPNKPPALPGVI